MKWQARYTKADYEPGTTRLKRVFAWLPTYIGGIMVWLETYEVLQGYIAQDYPVKIDGEGTAFRVSRWVDLSKRLIER